MQSRLSLILIASSLTCLGKWLVLEPDHVPHPFGLSLVDRLLALVFLYCPEMFLALRKYRALTSHGIGSVIHLGINVLYKLHSLLIWSL